MHGKDPFGSFLRLSHAICATCVSSRALMQGVKLALGPTEQAQQTPPNPDCWEIPLRGHEMTTESYAVVRAKLNQHCYHEHLSSAACIEGLSSLWGLDTASKRSKKSPKTPEKAWRMLPQVVKCWRKHATESKSRLRIRVVGGHHGR